MLSADAFADRPRAHPSVVEIDRPCLVCGYSLRGLLVDGVCPECGAGVARSLRGDLLRYASPEYLGRLHNGAYLVEIAVFLMLTGPAAAVLVGLGSRVFSAGSSQGVVNAARAVLGFVPSLVSAVASGLLVLGWWLVSTPDPGAARGKPGATSRKVLRVVVLVQAGLFLLSTLVQLGVLALGGAGVVVGAVAGVLGVGGWVSWAVTYFASNHYARHLARRIPDPALEARARGMTVFGIVLLSVPGIAFGVFAVAVVVGYLEGVFGGLACLMLPAVLIAALIWFALYLAMLDRLRVGLKGERRAAVVGAVAVPENLAGGPM